MQPRAMKNSQPNLQAYFEKRAVNYHKNSNSWPWFLIRRREADKIVKLMGNVTGKEILDLGCGAGYYTHVFLDKGASHVVAVDQSPTMISQLTHPQVTGVVDDIDQIDLDRSFNYLICAGVLEFVSNAEYVIANARRHASAGSRLVVLVPFKNLAGAMYRLYHRRHGFDISLFDHKKLETMFDGSGWKIVDRQFVQPFSLLVALDAEG